MKTIKLKGVDSRNYFAERLVNQYGSEALNKTAGPMRKAVQEIIDDRLAVRSTSLDVPEPPPSADITN